MTWIRPVLLVVLVTGSVLAGCGGSATVPLDGVTGELIITRQRDLIGRGFINVLTTNESGHALLITDHALVADDFAGVPAPARLVNVPDGRAIAIQVPYGVADDCTSDTPVTATLSFTWTTPADTTVHSADVPLDGTDILDRIRAEQCAGQALAAEADLSFDDVSIVDGTVHADLVITRTGGASEFTFAGPIGTVLVDVRNADDDAPVSLAASSASATIPLIFVVNRCDPHALAEVTKRFGLDLPVSVDGAAPQPVPIPLTPLVDDLETIVQECFDANG